MNKILVFRTDRIGDFLISTPIFSSLKRNYSKCKIDIICSKMNYDYISSFDFFDNIFIFPSNFLKKLSLFIKLGSYDHILVLDGKKRSIYISILKSSKNKILFTPSIFIKNLFKIFFDKVYLIDYNIPKIDIINKYLEEHNCDSKSEDINFLINYENFNSVKNQTYDQNYILLNFDEKWIYKDYIKNYQNIEPTLKEFINFIHHLSKNNKVIITNGFSENYIINKFKENNENLEFNNVIVKDKINIFELQSLIKHSSCVISCHGAPSHMASNYNKKIIDIVDNSEIKFFESYNHHFNNKIQIIRDNFDNLSKKILASI